MRHVEQVIDTLLKTDAHKATKFVSDKHVIRATRRLFNRKIQKRSNVDIVLTIGKPNFAERAFIKTCRKAGETFPVKKVQLKYPPKKRAA